jgi:hypothetical protein
MSTVGPEANWPSVRATPAETAASHSPSESTRQSFEQRGVKRSALRNSIHGGSNSARAIVTSICEVEALRVFIALNGGVIASGARHVVPAWLVAAALTSAAATPVI